MKNLAEKLQQICSKENVLYSEKDIFLYGYDASMEKGRPDFIVFPENAGQVQEIVKLANQFNIPFIARGAATNLCGATIAPGGGLIIDTSKMNKILKIDLHNQVVIVEPGVVNLELQNVLSEHGYFFAPDPASQKAATLGGNVALNAGGPHCIKYGVTVDHVLGAQVVMPDGELAAFGSTSVENPGYDFLGLINGSEGTLGIITQLTLKILPKPDGLQTMLVAFNNIQDAANTVSNIIANGIIPSTLEYMDNLCIRTVVSSLNVDYPIDAAAVLIIEIDGKKSALSQQVDEIKEICTKNNCANFRMAKDEADRTALWAGRRGALGAMARLKPSVIVFDGTVPRNRLPEALLKIDDITKAYNLQYGTLLHAGDGNIHPIIVYDESDKEETARVHKGCDEIMKLCVDLGGTITGEHGVGLEKMKAMSYLFSPDEFEIMKKLKMTFDKSNLCNPGKVFN